MLEAALAHGLGPGPWLFWSTVTGPMLIRQVGESPGRGAAFLVAFYGTMLATLTAQLLVFSFARRLGPGVVRAGTWIGALLLVVFGALLILFGAGAVDRYAL